MFGALLIIDAQSDAGSRVTPCITMESGSIIIWHRHQKHLQSRKICLKIIVLQHMSRAYRSVTIMQTGMSCWEPSECRAVKKPVSWTPRLKYDAPRSQYFTNNQWGVWDVDDLILFWSELISKSVAFVGDPAMVWLLGAISPWGGSSPERGPHLVGCHKYPSLCMFRFLLQSFESHESASESKITRDQQIDKLYNKGWQKILGW